MISEEMIIDTQTTKHDQLFENIDLNDKKNENFKTLNGHLTRTLLNTERDYGYSLVEAKLVNNSTLEKQYK